MLTTRKWCSQPLLNRRIHSWAFLIWDNVLFISGNNYGKLGLLAKMLHLTLRFLLQTSFPCINRFYSHHQTELLTNFTNNDVVVQGNSIFSFSIAQTILNFNLKSSLEQTEHILYHGLQGNLVISQNNRCNNYQRMASQ